MAARQLRQWSTFAAATRRGRHIIFCENSGWWRAGLRKWALQADGPGWHSTLLLNAASSYMHGVSADVGVVWLEVQRRRVCARCALWLRVCCYSTERVSQSVSALGSLIVSSSTKLQRAMPQGIIKNVNAPPACVICCAATHNLHQLTTHHRLVHYTALLICRGLI
jgi:hypothetical protein